MKTSLMFVGVTAALAVGAYAEDVSDASVEATDGNDAIAVAETAIAEGRKSDIKWFFTLPQCRSAQKGGEVLKPRETEWKPVEEGLYYPLGSSFRAGRENGVLVIAFGTSCTVTIKDGATFSSRSQPLGEQSRTISLTGGEVTVSLPGNLPEGLFCVTAPGFMVCNLNGESKYVYSDKGDGFVADVCCMTGSLSVRGRHYEIPKMSAADIVRIRSTHDELETMLYGKSGDYIVKLDRGQWLGPAMQADGTVKEVVQSGTLDWHLSISTRVQINRAVPRVGGHMSVTMMTFDTIGVMKNHFAYAEGRPEVNTGELVPAEVASGADAEGNEVSKRAAEVTTEAAAVENEAVAEDEPSSAGDDF